MNIHILKNITLSLMLGFLMLSINGYAAKEKPKKKEENAKADTTGAKPAPKKKKPFDDSLKTYKKHPGLFKIYQDSTNGGLLMVIKKDQIDKEYIYFSYSENGFTSAGTIKGMFRDNKIFTIKKYYNKIEFIALNNHFYFDKNNAISKAAEANISHSVLFSKKIMDTDNEKGEYLINADDIFLTEFLHRIKPPAPRGIPADAIFSLGGLSKEKSKILKIRNYPNNTDVVTEYVFENPYPSVGGGAEVTDERNVSIVLQHTLIEMPNNTYKPRFDDQRVGYFITQQNDMTSADAAPYHDFIHRWHLEKKDSLAEISEPKQPIEWWIENTTPKEYIEMIKQATLAWNSAFEKAGFKNAVTVKVQPDTAHWDAGDIRYNVMRWTSSPSPIFGGYGPSFVNPRTGQILGADIMLEYVFVTNRMKIERFFEQNGIENSPEQLFHTLHKDNFCGLAHHLHHQQMFGNMALKHFGSNEAMKDTFMKQAMFYLILHELGHTLGLNHNMKASQLYKPSEINNQLLTRKTGLTASVMDYPAANIAIDKTKQGDFFTIKPGPYDDWAIEYGYRQFADSAQEEKGLQKILSRSTEAALAFGNDADDMRSPGMHLDPRVMINDLSGDAIAYMSDRVKLVEKVSADMIKKYVVPGKSYQELRTAYQVLLIEKSNAAAVISRYVGGVYVDRSVAGQKTTAKPFVPVPLNEQKRAFSVVEKQFFAPDAFKIDNGLYNYLQYQRRGFNFYNINEDPKIHESVLSVQRQVLDHWLHPNLLKRLTDTELYGNKYGVNQFLTDLTDAIFKADASGSVNSFRQNLQVDYTQRLSLVIKNEQSPYDYIAKASVFKQLKRTEKMLRASLPLGDEKTKIHREYLLHIIEKALAVK